MPVDSKLNRSSEIMTSFTMLLTELHYFAPVIFYKKACQYTHIIFDQYEPFRKMTFRNRCIVAGANGPITLSIPVELGRNQRTRLKEVRIANRYHWQIQHWKTLESCYNRAPWFDYYRDELYLVYREQHEFLAEWNMRCFAWLAKKIDLAASIDFTTRHQPKYDAGTYVDDRNKLSPKTLDTLEHSLYYRQVFEEKTGFLPNLSILDLLFCTGPGAKELLIQP